MFSSPSLAPVIARCRTNAHAAPIPAPINTIGQDQGRDRSGAIKPPTPARPAPIAEGPTTSNRGGHSSRITVTVYAISPRIVATLY